MGTAVRETGRGQGGGAELKGGSRSVSRGKQREVGFHLEGSGDGGARAKGKGRIGGGVGKGGTGGGERARRGRMEGETP